MNQPTTLKETANKILDYISGYGDVGSFSEAEYIQAQDYIISLLSSHSSSLHRELVEKLEGEETSTPFGTVERPSDYNSGLSTAIQISNQVFGRTE